MTALLSWDNHVDDATLTNSTPTSSPANSVQSLALSKVQTRQVGDVFRQTCSTVTSPVESLTIDVDLGSSKTTRLVALINHNMQGRSYTLSFGTSSGSSDVGQVTGAFFSGKTADSLWDALYINSGTGYTARYVRLEVPMTEATTYDIGRLWMDYGWTPSCSLDFNLSIIDRSTKSKSRGGSTYVSDRQKLRLQQCRFWGLSDADFYGGSPDEGSFASMQAAVGSSGEVICLPLVGTQLQRQRLGVYGTISQDSPIRVIDKGPDGFITEKRFTLEEDR